MSTGETEQQICMVVSSWQPKGSNIFKSDAVEFLSGSFKLENQKPVVIIAYYRPSKRVVDYYLEKSKKEISSHRNKNKNSVIILGGDCNLPDIEWIDMTICGTQNPRKVSEAFLNVIFGATGRFFNKEGQLFGSDSHQSSRL